MSIYKNSWVAEANILNWKSNYNVCHYSLPNSMLIYHNFQKKFSKFYQKCKFEAPAISSDMTENDKIIIV